MRVLVISRTQISRNILCTIIELLLTSVCILGIEGQNVVFFEDTERAEVAITLITIRFKPVVPDSDEVLQFVGINVTVGVQYLHD